MGTKFDQDLEKEMELLKLKKGFKEKGFRGNNRNLIRNIHSDFSEDINPKAGKSLETEAKKVNITKGIIEPFLKEEHSNENTAQNSIYYKSNSEEQQKKEKEWMNQLSMETEGQKQQEKINNISNNMKNNLKNPRKLLIGWGTVVALVLIIYSSVHADRAQNTDDQLQMQTYSNAESLGEQVSSELSSNDNPPILDENPPTIDDDNKNDNEENNNLSLDNLDQKEFFMIGTINENLNVHMKLNFNNGEVTGTYYYDSDKTDIKLKGVYDKDNNINMNELDNNENITGMFSGKISTSGEFIGNWSNTDGTKQLPFAINSNNQTTVDDSYPAYDDEDFVFPDSSRVLLNKNEVAALSKEKLVIARNEIYARHGYVFSTQPYIGYFKSKSWYTANPSFKGLDEELKN